MKPTQRQIDEFLYKFSKLTRDQQECIVEFIEVMKKLEGATPEEQQEIIDNITDQRIIDFIKDEKSKLS